MFIANPNGSVIVHLHDDAGNEIDTFPATRSLFTTQKQQVSQPPSSLDWFKQIYVADTDEGLLELFQKEPVAHAAPSGTTGSTLQATFSIARKGKKPKVYHNQSVIAVGDPIAGANPPVFLTKEIFVSPVEITKGNKLFDLWTQQTAKFGPKQTSNAPQNTPPGASQPQP